MNKQALCVLTAGACSVVAASAVDFSITKTLIDIALDNEPPKILELLQKRISKSTRTNEFLNEMARTEERLLQKDNTVVTITAEDGTELTGHWVPTDLPYKLRSVVANKLCKRKTGYGSEEFSTVESLKAVKIPVLFLHGTDDNFVPVSMAYENFKACASPKRIFVVPGADHGMSYYLDREGYENAMKSFWNDYD